MIYSHSRLAPPLSKVKRPGDGVLAAKAQNPAADTPAPEAAIDALVAALYGVALPA